MSPEQRKAFDRVVAREIVEMADGRRYISDDNWETARLVSPSGRSRNLTGKDLHFAQFLAASQTSWTGNAS